MSSNIPVTPPTDESPKQPLVARPPRLQLRVSGARVGSASRPTTSGPAAAGYKPAIRSDLPTRQLGLRVHTANLPARGYDADTGEVTEVTEVIK
ncbi:MAG: hypothetical protein H6Q90_2873 [Deltaproteobacteria bacterium]|nr:hypothetical protein [Deltaproteobacteria bacterium]